MESVQNQVTGEAVHRCASAVRGLILRDSHMRAGTQALVYAHSSGHICIHARAPMQAYSLTQTPHTQYTRMYAHTVD